MISTVFFVDGGEGRWLIGADRIVSVKVEAMIAISQVSEEPE